MCGIAGIFNLNKEPVPEQPLREMAKALVHRGPDGEGYFIEQHIGLAHRRLAIIDTSDLAAQPMTSGNKNWVITFNGCIYNFRELRTELQEKGHCFKSSSDTEVIAEGLAAYGASFFERLNGMFAVAAWNKEEEAIYLSRDRYGMKPLYYLFTGKTLVFASEIKAILKHPAYKIAVDHDALNQYFSFQNVFTYNTLFKDIHILPPANTIKITTQTSYITHHSWWDYDLTQPDESISFEDAATITQQAFEKAVERQMVSDVSLGSYLSGGMDSGSVTAIASKHIKGISTFTAGFDMSTVTGTEANYDERRDAEFTANHFGTTHYEQVIHAGDMGKSLAKIVWHIEDLRAGMSYPNYYISRLASKSVKVCLQGTGGDELYGGYPWRYYRAFRSLNQTEFFNAYYSFWQRLVTDEAKSKLFHKTTFQKIDIEQPRKVFERVFTFNTNLQYRTPEQHINNSLYFELKTFLPAILLIGDKLSMANSLEERCPFLDNDLVAVSQKIPVRYKLGNLEDMIRLDENEFRDKRNVYREFSEGKNVLRHAMRAFLPEHITNRKKQGFSAPDASWYRGENALYIRELLLNKKTASSEFINPAYIEKIVKEHTEQKINHRLLIWSFLCFEWWCKLFLNGEQHDC
jgi:asparagine synthase (glutamine-hydrolysing)